DKTAGISIYSSSLSNIIAGDSIEVTGVLTIYKGQLEITPVNSFHVIQSGRPLPAPKLIHFNDAGLSSFESMRVNLSCMGVASCEPKFDSYWYTIFDTRGNTSKLVMSHTGSQIPSSSVAVTGIWVNVDNEFQLWSQSLISNTQGGCKIIPKGLVSYNGHATSLSWEVSPESNSWVEYGINTFNQVLLPEKGITLTSILINNLIAGQLYEARLGQVSPTTDTIYSPVVYFSSPSVTSTPIQIFFDKSIDASYSDGNHPAGTGSSIIENDVIARIDQVSSTMDIAMYNDTRTSIVDAIRRAVQRGVAVRYVAEESTSNTALNGTLPFPVLYRHGNGIMHNKFIIADADDTDKAWLWTGSTNFTSAQLSTDANHAYVITDQALALNYRHEFNELWGTQPNNTGAKEGEQKSDNTGHLFNIDGINIESYFSPSDETNCHILDALKSADHQVLIGLLLITKDDLVDEIISLHQQGIEVRLIVEDAGTSSLALSRLMQAGVNVEIHDLSGLFHHKYAIIDEGYPDSDPTVISGSHNWTLSADIVNDENTLIFHDQSIANIFRQEYEARWSELNPTGTISISDNPSLTLHPNPASDHVEMTNPLGDKCDITLIDVNGNIVGKQRLDSHATINFPIGQSIPDGIYLVHWSWLKDHAVSKLVIHK
ncbi:MAG: phospholipase D-like domain-containing protein, partial [Saprospiraceae bacterium]